MKATSHAEMPFSQTLFAWLAHRLVEAIAAVRPVHRADEIAADVAASSNPSGA